MGISCILMRGVFVLQSLNIYAYECTLHFCTHLCTDIFLGTSRAEPVLFHTQPTGGLHWTIRSDRREPQESTSGQLTRIPARLN